MKNCPSCKKETEDAASECTGCGLIFSKWEAMQRRTEAAKTADAPGTPEESPSSRAMAPGPTEGSGMAVNAVLLAALAFGVWGAYAHFTGRKALPAGPNIRLSPMGRQVVREAAGAAQNFAANQAAGPSARAEPSAPASPDQFEAMKSAYLARIAATERRDWNGLIAHLSSERVAELESILKPDVPPMAAAMMEITPEMGVEDRKKAVLNFHARLMAKDLAFTEGKVSGDRGLLKATGLPPMGEGRSSVTLLFVLEDREWKHQEESWEMSFTSDEAAGSMTGIQPGADPSGPSPAKPPNP